MSATMLSLLGFLAWTLLLLVLMEVRRTHLVLTGQVPATGFTGASSGTGGKPGMQASIIASTTLSIWQDPPATAPAW